MEKIISSLQVSQVTNFYNLTLDSLQVKEQTINAVTTNKLDIKDCELRTDANKMHLTNSATSALTYTTGFISSRANGQFARNMLANQNYFYPIGDSTFTPFFALSSTSTQSFCCGRIWCENGKFRRNFGKIMIEICISPMFVKSIICIII